MHYPETQALSATGVAVESGLSISVRRGEYIENHHQAWVLVSDSLGNLRISSTPNPSVAAAYACFFRSAAKPFQAWPLVMYGHHRNLDPIELALACGSHSGSPEQTALAEQILAKAGLGIDALQCGPQSPLDPKVFPKGTESATPIHNNCSGKHAAMLYLCQQMGWDLTHYLDASHPLQVVIKKELCRLANMPDCPTAIDGCGAPTYYLPLATMARLYAQLSQASETKTAEFYPIVQAMKQHPEMVGGVGRLDTILMQTTQGRLLSKVGADGLLCVARLGYDQGLALKIADGNNAIRDIVAIQVLHNLGWINDADLKRFTSLSWLSPQRLNTQGKVVGDIQVDLSTLTRRG